MPAGIQPGPRLLPRPSPWLACRVSFRAFLLLAPVVAFASAAALAQAPAGPVAPLPSALAPAVFAPDKALHAGGSAAMTIAVYGVASQFTRSVWIRSFAAATLVGAAGGAKEVFDVLRGGQADVLDLAADTAGISAGLVVMWALEAAFEWVRASNRASDVESVHPSIGRLGRSPRRLRWTRTRQSLNFAPDVILVPSTWSPTCFDP